MKYRFPLNLMLASALLAGSAMAATTAAATDSDAQIAARLGHEIRVALRVREGDVELVGQVSQPFKKADIGRLAQRVPGVRSVTNELKVLPTSPFDDRLRVQIARALYRDSVLSRYALQSVPPIHIIVDNGHVTLEGVVSSEKEKNDAGIRAAQAGLSFGQVTNNLRVERPSTKG